MTVNRLKYNDKGGKERFMHELQSWCRSNHYQITEEQEEKVYKYLQQMRNPSLFHFGLCFKNLGLDKLKVYNPKK